MSDESLQLAVDSILYFLSCHCYLHSVSAPQKATTVAGITRRRTRETLLCTMCEKKSVWFVSSNQRSRPLMSNASHLRRCCRCGESRVEVSSFQSWPRMESEEIKHLGCFDIRLPAGRSLPRPSAWCLSPPLGVLSTGEMLIMLLQSWVDIVVQPSDYSCISRVKRTPCLKSEQFQHQTI